MYIKSVIIDGFKSYGQRTEIKGFDPLFNAITGLNGTGKSNILDSICFLLGITNLTHVRAMNMQELIYKNGQAGVTKATVTIIFDNMDKAQSPLGYEQCDEITITRQIVMGGKNKYLINGSNVPNSRVQDLFQSVQLNVNNPHFLIMQGRVTKVLNMKPPEILSMIEEAAGTRMYETKKQSAVKTIEKKDAKLREINSIIDEEISPALDKLKGERAQYFQFQKTQRELEQLTKLHAAYTYTVLEAACEKVKERYEEVSKAVETLQTNIASAQKEIPPLEQEMESMTRKKAKESGPLLEKLENAVAEKHKAEAKVLANVKNIGDSIKREEKRVQQIMKSLADDQATLDTKEKVHEGLAEGFQKLKEAEEKGKEALAAAQKRLQAISSGMFASEDGQVATLAEQLMAVKQSIAEAETEHKRCEMKLKHDESEYQKKSQDVKKIQDLLAKDQQNYKNMEVQIAKIKKEMDKCNYDEAHYQQVEEEYKALREEITQVRDTAATLEDRIPQLRFQYADPEPNFDHSAVKGMLCKLFTVTDKAATLALDVTAGGKLCNVVVDTERTGKKLLERGQLERRVTFVPLNKIQPRYVDSRAVKTAENLVGKENVQPAMNLVDCNEDVKKAVAFAFGNTLICKDMDVAKKVAFHRNVMTKCVTLEGDVVDPGGVITGGSRPDSATLLSKLPELMAKQKQLNEMQQRMKALDNQLRNVQPVAQKYRELKQQYDLKVYEFDLMKQRAQETSHQRQAQEVIDLEQGIATLKETISESDKKVKEGQKKVKDLEHKMKNADSLKAQELDAAKKAVEEAKKQAEDSRNQWKAKEQEAQTMTLELEELRSGIQNGKEQLKSAEDLVKELNGNQAEAHNGLDEARAELAQAQKELDDAKKAVEERNADFNKKAAKLDQLKAQVGEWELGIKSKEHIVSKAKQEVKDTQNQLTSIVRKHGWIEAEKQYFGQAGSCYDFEANNAAAAGKKIQQLEESNEKMRRSVNMQAMNMLEEAEERYKDLMKKKKIVEKDKLKIQSVIAELDEKKKEALMKAWEKVNKDFGSIFSNLLPGTTAKLQPPDGQTVLDGLEVRVAFGGVWKESLTELSGGQRSLVALSLILALLLFKPAPIYILDEVDAALDLSHTQNIGQMLKTHFKKSQFIVVSLKDGMFNNANVLFRTKFVDGVSNVSRSVQK